MSPGFGIGTLVSKLVDGKDFMVKGILTIRSQGMPQSLSKQQTSHKRYVVENRMATAFEGQQRLL